MEHVLQLIQARFATAKSMFGAISNVANGLGNNALKGPLQRTAENLRLLDDAEGAVAPLREIDLLHAKRLANLIAMGDEASPDVQKDILNMLVKDVRFRRQIVSEVMQQAGMVRATVRVLQAAFLIGLLVIMNVPLWRNYFLEGESSHRVVLITLTLLAAVGSMYFEFELYSKVEGASR